MPDATATDLSNLRRDIDGELVLPGDGGWDDARRAWNLAVDLQPAAVVQVAGTSDIGRVVDFARERGLKVAALSTGHGAGAMGALTDTILLRTGRLNGLEIDAAERRVRVQAGVFAGDVAVAASEAGLSAPLGSSPTVGVIGLTLGGGIGWLSRRYGLSCNNVRAIELVTADGAERRVDTDNDPELFYALRGGGGGSFGVVTALEIELYPVTEVYAGMVAWPVDRAAEITEAYREWLPGTPDEMTAQLRFMNLPPIPALPEPLRGKSLVDVTGAFSGDPVAGEELVRPLREIGGAVWDTWEVQQAAALRHLAMDPEEPVPGAGDQVLLGELTPEAAAALVAVGSDSDSPLVAVQVRQLGGALGREADGAGALPMLDAEHLVFATGAVFDAASRVAVEEHLDRMQRELAPYSTGGRALNFAERPGDVSAAFRPEAWKRLQAVKARYDPDGLFVAAHQVR